MRVTDQTGAAADLNKEQYAQTMGAYNAFQHRVKTSIIPTQSHVARLPGGGKAQMRHSFGANTVLVTVPAQKTKSNTIWFDVDVDVDFLVIRYGLQLEEDKLRTRFTAPFQSNYVGRGEGNSIISKGLELASFGFVSHEEGEFYFEKLVIDIRKVVKIYNHTKISIEITGDVEYGAAYIYTKAFKGSEGGEVVANRFDYYYGYPLAIELDTQTNIISSVG